MLHIPSGNIFFFSLLILSFHRSSSELSRPVMSHPSTSSILLVTGTTTFHVSTRRSSLRSVVPEVSSSRRSLIEKKCNSDQVRRVVAIPSSHIAYIESEIEIPCRTSAASLWVRPRSNLPRQLSDGAPQRCAGASLAFGHSSNQSTGQVERVTNRVGRTERGETRGPLWTLGRTTHGAALLELHCIDRRDGVRQCSL